MLRDVQDRPDRRPGDPERNERARVVVAHRHHVGPRLVRGPVDGPLGVHRPPALIDRPVLEIELHEVAALDQLRAPRARQEVAVRPLRVPDAHVPESVDHVLVREDAVGDHEVVSRVSRTESGIGALLSG